MVGVRTSATAGGTCEKVARARTRNRDFMRGHSVSWNGRCCDLPGVRPWRVEGCSGVADRSDSATIASAGARKRARTSPRKPLEIGLDRDLPGRRIPETSRSLFSPRAARRARAWVALAAAIAWPATAGIAAPTTPADNAFPVTLGTFSTTMIGSAPARTHNVRLATAALDGQVLEPGDVWSFNRSVGPRTPERGYAMAPVILRETRQLQLGGGICQAASTVFVAALLSGLSSPERHRHSSPIDYVPLGEDATISWGLKDLKIRNDLDQRLRLRVEILGSTLTARFEAEEAIEASFEIATEEIDQPQAADAASAGREIEVYRIRRVAGQEVEREFLHRDVFPAGRARPSREL